MPSTLCGIGTYSLPYDPCDKFAPGGTNLWITDYVSNGTFVPTFGPYNLITGATGTGGGLIDSYNIIDQQSRVEYLGWTWAPSDTTNRGNLGKLTLTFFIWGVNAKNLYIASGINGSLVRAIMSDINGRYFHIGTTKPALVKIGNALSGVAAGDLPGFEMTLTVDNTNIVYEMDETTALFLTKNT